MKGLVLVNRRPDPSANAGGCGLYCNSSEAGADRGEQNEKSLVNTFKNLRSRLVI